MRGVSHKRIEYGRLREESRNIDIAWAAGIIDGEGCFHISNSRPDTKSGAINRSYSLYLKVTMGHKPTIERLLDIFGVGSIHLVTQTKYNQAWTWLTTSHKALGVTNIVRPYLFTKASEADIAIEFMLLPLAPRGGGAKFRGTPPDLLAARHNLWDRMRRAKPLFRFRDDAT